MKRLVPVALLLAALSGCAVRAAVPGAAFAVGPGYPRYYRQANWPRWQPGGYWRGRPDCD